MGWLLKQNPNEIQRYFTITISLIGHLCLFPCNLFYSSSQESGMGSSLTHAGFMILNHEECNFSEKLLLPQWETLLWAEVQKIKKKIKLIMSSAGCKQGRLAAGAASKEKCAPWRGRKARQGTGICVIRRSVSLAAAGRHGRAVSSSGGGLSWWASAWEGRNIKQHNINYITVLLILTHLIVKIHHLILLLSVFTVHPQRLSHFFSSLRMSHCKIWGCYVLLSDWHNFN